MFGSHFRVWVAVARCKVRGQSALFPLLFSAMMLTCGAADAQDCKPLQYLGGMPISVGEDGGVETAALINNVTTPVKLIAGRLNFLSHEAVKKFSLTEHASSVEIHASTGEISKTYAAPPQFSIGPVSGDIAFTVFGAANDLPSVSLGTFAKFDMDFDFSSRRLNLFSSDHCEGKVTYFSTGAVAVIPYEGSQFEFAVNLDDHATKAFLFGDGPESIIGLAEATKLFGLTSESPGMEPVLKNGNLVGYRHTFSTLALEGITIKNPVFLVIPEKLKDMFKEKPTGSLLAESPYKEARIEMAIGKKILRQLHIYIATKERKLYIAPGSEAAAKLLPALNPASAQ